MGIIASKGNNKTLLIDLCKERKKLMRAARDARYHLARSHLHYFKSLLGFSNALNQFVNSDLIVIPHSDDDSSISELICCESDSDSDSDSDSECLVCDQSQPAPLSNNDDLNTQTFGFGDGACCSSNYQEDMEKSRGWLGFEEKEFVSAPTETEMRGSQNLSSIQQNHDPADDIFGLYDSIYNSHRGYIEPDKRYYEVESDGFREVRDREGIPDLEPESDHNSLIRKNQKKKKKKKTKNVKEISSVAGEIDKKDVEANTCNGQVSGEIDKTDVEANTCIGQVSGEIDSSNETCGQETRKSTPEIVTEGVVTGSGEEVCDEGYETPCSTFSELSGSSGLTDLRNVVERINGICEKAVSYSEVSELLEVTRVAYHRSLGSHFMGFASRILGTSRKVFRPQDLEGSLSMTLEKLCMWEKKLHTEVKVEEKLRVSYEKAYKILKHLDIIGAESDKIYEVQTLVKLLLSRINVSVRALESIAMKIHKIRDEELWFQVIEIIIGFKKMWRFLAKCHHKQFQVISKSNSCVHIVEKGSRKSTKKVEKQISRYRESLKGYIDAHTSFVKLLNEWLNRNIMEEDAAETEAPEIFRLCREWLREIENVDETKVLSAVEEMRLRFQGLGLKQAEEKKQRKITKRLSKELERKTKELEEICGMEIVVSTSDSGPTASMMVEPELLSLRESVAQETTKHENVRRELNDTVSETLQECLVLVYEALEDFCFANFQAYENIRIVPTETL